MPLNPAYTAAQVVSALQHVQATAFVLSTEIHLPFKQPKRTLELLQQVRDHFMQDCFEPVVLLVNNSSSSTSLLIISVDIRLSHTYGV